MNKLIFVRGIIFAASLLLQLSASLHSHAMPGDVDLSFDAGSGVNGEVSAMALQPDGKLIIGGAFTTVKGLTRFYLARLNADGSGDATFNAGTNADRYISGIAVQPDGKVIFISNYASEVTRLNPDGTLDTSFASASENLPLRSSFDCIALQPDGKIVVGGNFSEPNQTGSLDAHALLVRLNANGSIDNTFTAGSADFGSIIFSVTLQPDGKILIGGAIATPVNGTNHLGIARLNADGTLDTDFRFGADGIIHSVQLQTDGKILLAGYAIGSDSDRNGIVRLNADGSRDGSFAAGVDANSSLLSCAVQTDGKIICIGSYVYVGGANRDGLVRLNSNGSVDVAFNPTTKAPNNAPAGIMLQPDGKILIGGGFTLVNDTNRERLVRLNSDGSLDVGFVPGSSINANVNSLALQTDGRVIIGGDFTIVAGATRNGVARLDSNGNLNTGFDPGAGPAGPYNGWEASVTVVAMQSDGKILIAGDFRSFNGVDRNRLVRLNIDGTVDTSFVPWSGPPLANYSFQPLRLVVQPDGRILVGGNGASNSDPTGLVRLNANGSFDTSFHADILGSIGGDYAVINSIALEPDGKILAGGYVVKSDVPYLLLTRLTADGSRVPNFPTAGGSAGVTCIVLQPDGRILASGWYGDGSWISRSNNDGSADDTFKPGLADGDIHSVLIQPDGKILIVGSFTSFNGTNRNRVALLNSNGSLDTNFNLGPGIGEVRSAAFQPDGKILLSSGITTLNGVVRPGIARLFGDSITPSLNIARLNASVIVSWPTPPQSFQLQETADLALRDWFPVAQAAVTNADQISVTVPTPVGQKFFRLKSK